MTTSSDNPKNQGPAGPSDDVHSPVLVPESPAGPSDDVYPPVLVPESPAAVPDWQAPPQLASAAGGRAFVAALEALKIYEEEGRFGRLEASGAPKLPDLPSASAGLEKAVPWLSPESFPSGQSGAPGALAPESRSLTENYHSEYISYGDVVSYADVVSFAKEAGMSGPLPADASSDYPSPAAPFQAGQARDDFPILGLKVEGGKPLVWLDNAATTQKPRQVIERLGKYYREENSNVHRGAHALATVATEAYESARRTTARFIGAGGPENIVFVRGATEGLNLVANAFAAPRLGPGDEILLTVLEHHANIVPWQMVARKTGARIAVAPVDDSGQIVLSEFARRLSGRTKIASVSHVSNALGTIAPVEEIVALCRARSVPVVVDAAQSVAHLPINVAELGADFLVFSGHKIYGPAGIGAVYGTTEALRGSVPYQGGGGMIADVTFERTVYRDPPVRFEAGTPNIAGAAGLEAALDYLDSLGLSRVAAYEDLLLNYATDRLSSVPGLSIVGTAWRKTGVISFVLKGKSVREVGSRLAGEGLAVRAGHHCAQPILRRFGLEETVRASLALYNTPDEVDFLTDVLRGLQAGA